MPTPEPATLSKDDVARIQRRTLRVVSIGQILGGAGLSAGATVGGLIAQDMLKSSSVTGLPAAILTLGAAVTAYLVGRFAEQHGRRSGLALGFLAASIGGAGVVLSAVLSWAPLFFVSLFLYGAGTATNMIARYAGTDLATPHERGKAISLAMVWTTIGAVAGPNLITPLGRLAEAIGLPALTGPFLLGAVAYAAAGTVLYTFMRPDPLLLARSLTGHRDLSKHSHFNGRIHIDAYAGAAVMVLSMITMVAIMTMTPIHMRAHHHDLGDVGLVISLHIGAMYMPSLITGRLVDRVGRAAVASASGFTLLLSGIVAAVAPGGSLVVLIVALMLLGLGWNFGLIAGTALVVDATDPSSRARIQGTIDVLISLSGAGAASLSGPIMTSNSYAKLSLLGGGMALLLIPVLYLTQRNSASA